MSTIIELAVSYKTPISLEEAVSAIILKSCAVYLQDEPIQVKGFLGASNGDNGYKLITADNTSYKRWGKLDFAKPTHTSITIEARQFSELEQFVSYIPIIEEEAGWVLIYDNPLTTLRLNKKRDIMKKTSGVLIESREGELSYEYLNSLRFVSAHDYTQKILVELEEETK